MISRAADAEMSRRIEKKEGMIGPESVGLRGQSDFSIPYRPYYTVILELPRGRDIVGPIGKVVAMIETRVT